jgi:hypothetical protein
VFLSINYDATFILNYHRAGEYFQEVNGTPSKLSYLLHVIEYQHRGLPHAHIVLKLEGVPDGKEAKKSWMAKHIQARYPDPPAVNATEKELEDHAEYEARITRFMLHSCFSGERGCKNVHGICVRGYMDNVCTNDNTFTEKGFPKYARPTLKDMNVVPHNRAILMDWNGHCNVEVRVRLRVKVRVRLGLGLLKYTKTLFLIPTGLFLQLCCAVPVQVSFQREQEDFYSFE